MTQADAESFLAKAEEYLASAEDNLILERYTVAAGDAIHAGISAKDAIVTALTGTTGKRKDHLAAANELRLALGQRPITTSADHAIRELLAAKPDVEYGVAMLTPTKSTTLVRRARTLVETAINIVRLKQ